MLQIDISCTSWQTSNQDRLLQVIYSLSSQCTSHSVQCVVDSVLYCACVLHLSFQLLVKKIFFVVKLQDHGICKILNLKKCASSSVCRPAWSGVSCP